MFTFKSIETALYRIAKRLYTLMAPGVSQNPCFIYSKDIRILNQGFYYKHHASCRKRHAIVICALLGTLFGTPFGAILGTSMFSVSLPQGLPPLAGLPA